ncbi:hypothetical protein RU639_011122 [Aspergillus parasiticus]
MEAPNNAQQYNMGPELQQVQRAWERIRVASPIYAFLLSDIDIYNAEKGVFHSRIQVAPHHLNSKGTLHGVFSACVTDWAGGLAIASYGLDSTGSLAFTSITISKRTETGQTTIVAHGTHTKYIRIR